jgi:hypothetical protein
MKAKELLGIVQAAYTRLEQLFRAMAGTHVSRDAVEDNRSEPLSGRCTSHEHCVLKLILCRLSLLG